MSQSQKYITKSAYQLSPVSSIVFYLYCKLSNLFALSGSYRGSGLRNTTSPIWISWFPRRADEMVIYTSPMWYVFDMGWGMKTPPQHWSTPLSQTKSCGHMHLTCLIWGCLSLTLQSQSKLSISIMVDRRRWGFFTSLGWTMLGLTVRVNLGH